MAQVKNEITAWLDDVGLAQYYPLLHAIKFKSLKQISGLNPDEFKQALKKELSNNHPLAEQMGFSEIPAPHLGDFGAAIRDLNHQFDKTGTYNKIPKYKNIKHKIKQLK